MIAMFRKVNESFNLQLGLRGMAAQSVIATAAGLVMPREGTWIAVLGVTCFVVALVLLTGAWLVGRRPAVLEGEIVEQQPQLTDVQPHMHCTPALTQGT